MTRSSRSLARLALAWGVASGVAFAGAAALWADDPAKRGDPAKKGDPASAVVAKADDSADAKARRKPAADITPAREAAAMTFVEQHHPELTGLLSLLHEQSPKDYDRAIRDLFRESERLANLRERDEARHELELDLWKVNSRLQLATARLSMGDSPELRRELRALLLEQIDARRAVLAHEREKIADRMSRLDKQRSAMAERALRALLGGSEGSSPPPRAGNSPRAQ